MAYSERRPKYCTKEEWRMMIGYLEAQDMQAKKDYVAHYADLPRPMQGELGYLMSALKAAVQGCVSPLRDSYIENMISLHQIIRPIEFDGWAGADGDLGPAYAFCSDCFDLDNPVLFYSDECIAADEAAAPEFIESAEVIAEYAKAAAEKAAAALEKAEEAAYYSAKAQTEAAAAFALDAAVYTAKAEEAAKRAADTLAAFLNQEAEAAAPESGEAAADLLKMAAALAVGFFGFYVVFAIFGI